MEKGKVSFCVSDTGNTQALLLCLASVINARLVPHRIQLRLEGEFPSFANFYLEQIAELARQSEIGFSIHIGKSNGVRSARDWHLENCQTEYMWMGDNDVIYHPDCLQHLCRAEWPLNTLYMQGVKSDVNNRRGYPDFFAGVHPRSEIKDGCSFNHRYDQLPELLHLNPKTTIPSVEVHTLDTGNVLINAQIARAANIRFQLFPESYNSGGEDTLFALQAHHYGLKGRFCPFAVSYHLEKEKVAFGEFAARGEMILRACDLLGYDKEVVKREFMPFLTIYHETKTKDESANSWTGNQEASEDNSEEYVKARKGKDHEE